MLFSRKLAAQLSATAVKSSPTLFPKRMNHMPSSNYKQIIQTCRWHPFSTAAALEQAAVTEIQRAAQQAIDERGAFVIVLAGGTTPRKVYQALRNTQSQWRSWHVYFGDERCLPSDHVERNSLMAAQAWLDHVTIPPSQIHFIPSEKGASVAADEYAKTVKPVALFDLVLLGLGEDGHTASLFPDHELGDTAKAPATLAVLDAPKPPAQRVSLSAHRLSDARQVMFLITGNNKAHAVTDWRAGIPIPAAAITPEKGVDVYIEN
jgi:6-phosphogluconolactonase